MLYASRDNQNAGFTSGAASFRAAGVGNTLHFKRHRNDPWPCGITALCVNVPGPEFYLKSIWTICPICLKGLFNGT